MNKEEAIVSIKQSMRDLSDVIERFDQLNQRNLERLKDLEKPCNCGSGQTWFSCNVKGENCVR